MILLKIKKDLDVIKGLMDISIEKKVGEEVEAAQSLSRELYLYEADGDLIDTHDNQGDYIE